MSERLIDIITAMVHGGVNARRTLSRGLIITYMAPEPDTPREQWRYSLTAARVSVWPDDQELKIVRDCLYKSWRKHPTALIYNESTWIKKETKLPPAPHRQAGATLGTFTITWRQWPVRDMFSAPAGIQDTLRAALARR